MSIQSIMNEDVNGKELVDLAQATAKTLVRNGLKNTQLRAVFTEVHLIEAMWMV
mgnify:CR=1 FL=1